MHKKDSECIHALKRLKERFNIEITKEEYKSIVNSIKNLGTGKKRIYEVKFLEKQSNARSLYKIYYNDIELYAIYNKINGSICTFLRKEFLNEFAEG